MTTLLDLTNQAVKALSLDAILQRVTDTALRLIPADHVSVRLLDEAGAALVCRARAGAGSQAPPLHLRPGEGVLGWVVQNGRGAHVRDAKQDERFKIAEDQGFSVRSLLAVPLVVEGKVQGVLAMSAASPQAFSPDDEILAQLLGNWILPFLKLARLGAVGGR